MRENFNWKKLSAIVALAARKGRRPRLLFDIVDGAFNGALVLCFLVRLLAQIDGRVLLVWDGAPIHRTAETRDFLRRPDVAARLSVMPLPPYSPELNPEELVNAHIKAQRLANHAPATAAQLREAAIGELRRAARRPRLLSNILASSRHGLLRNTDLRKEVM